MEDEQAAIDAVLKFAVLALVVGAVLGLATFLGIKTLGVGGGNGGPTADPLPGDTPSALPTVALSDPGSTPSKSPSAAPSEEPSTTAPPKGAMKLNASPGQVAPGERINLTGTYQGRDNLTLVVQRKTGGAWSQFADVTVPVRVGTFSTYVITSRSGIQVFRVFDQQANKGSNAVKVTVG